jgi:hypothetical protein
MNSPFCLGQFLPIFKLVNELHCFLKLSFNTLAGKLYLNTDPPPPPPKKNYFFIMVQLMPEVNTNLLPTVLFFFQHWSVFTNNTKLEEFFTIEGFKDRCRQPWKILIIWGLPSHQLFGAPYKTILKGSNISKIGAFSVTDKYSTLFQFPLYCY